MMMMMMMMMMMPLTSSLWKPHQNWRVQDALMLDPKMIYLSDVMQLAGFLALKRVIHLAHQTQNLVAHQMLESQILLSSHTNQVCHVMWTSILSWKHHQTRIVVTLRLHLNQKQLATLDWTRVVTLTTYNSPSCKY